MGYEQDFKFKLALKSLYDSAKSISDKVFVANRPSAVPNQMKEFIVVALPEQIKPMVYGGGFGNVETYCTIEAYVRLKKSGAEDVDKMEAIINKITSLFPISNEVMTASRPSVMLRGSDGLGFSAALIRAAITIK